MIIAARAISTHPDGGVCVAKRRYNPFIARFSPRENRAMNESRIYRQASSRHLSNSSTMLS